MLRFLSELSANNRREWLLEHKEFQKEAMGQFEMLVQGIVSDLSADDPALGHLFAKDIIYRLHRDVRFSADKSPYNPTFRAHIAPAGRRFIPVGHYLHIAPGSIFLGGGLYAAQFPEVTTRIRDDLVARGEEFLAILETDDFKQNFTLIGEKLKNLPRGYPAELPQSVYLKHKSWAIQCDLDDGALDDVEAFRCAAVQKFRLMRPFNAYLNRALDGLVCRNTK